MKTINFNGFSILDEPMPKHILQAQVYAELAKQGKIDGVPLGVEIPTLSGIIFLYISKNDSREREFKVALDETTARNEIKKIVVVDTCIVERRLPNRILECPTLLSPVAKKCPACSYCFGQQTFDDIERSKGY
jgi:hypothetical protein